MRSDIPERLSQSSHDLAPDAIVALFELELRTGTKFRVSPAGSITWQGNFYEEIPCNMTGVGQNSDAQENRPKFTFVNPQGILSGAILRGDLDGAFVTRIRVLKQDLDDNLDFAIRETFRVSRVMQMGQEIVALELRTNLDGQLFRLPARAYFPPEFPHVKLQ